MALPVVVARAQSPRCEWLAGDFHVHTVYSHDAYGGPEDENTGPDDLNTLGWTPGQQGAIAETRGLDFIAITDHDNIEAYLRRNTPATGVGLYESGWGLTDQVPGGEPLVWVPDYENSIGGHAQMHGATKVYDDSVGVVAQAEELRADGGAFQINHPSDMDWHDDTGNYLYPGFAPDALEVWNIGAWFYEPPMPATNDHEFPLQMYTDFLDQGFHVAATGGSDNHWRATTAVQGVGQPTTWVCASDRSSASIIEAVKANRTSISHQPPAYMGARAYLYADADRTQPGFEAMIGDTVLPGSRIEAVVENAEGAWLQLVTNDGDVLAKELITSFNFTQTFEVPDSSTWVRAEVFYEDGREGRRLLQPLCEASNQLFGTDRDERNTYCENRLSVVALTSPIYFAAPEETFDPATTLAYDGDTRVKVGSTATLAATLLDSKGNELAGRTITFTFRGDSYQAITNDDGRASVDVRVSGPPGNYEVVATFQGDPSYEGSTDRETISVTTGDGSHP